MAIVAGDILFKFSIASVTTGNTDPSSPDLSLGGQVSTTEMTNGALHNLFDVISGDENANLDVEYRCLFIHNNHATLTFHDVVVWIASQVPNGANAALSVDTTGVTDVDAIIPQAKAIPDENTAPAGQVFASPVDKATALVIGDIPAGSVVGIWVQRTAADSPALDLDGVTIRFEGNTEE